MGNGILIRSANFTGENNGSRIWGLPYSYNHLADLNNRVFNNTLFGNFAMLHLTPGKLKSSLGFIRSVKGFVNNFIPFVPEFDERPYLWQADWYNYLSYFNTMAQATLTMIYQMNGADPWGVSNKILFSYDYNNQFSKGNGNIYSDIPIDNTPADELNDLNTLKVYTAYSKVKEYERLIKNNETLMQQAKAQALSNNTSIEKVEKYYATKIALLNSEKTDASRLYGKLFKELEGKYSKIAISGNTDSQKMISTTYQNLKEKRMKTTRNFGMTYFMEASSSISEDVSNSFGSSSYEEEANAAAEEARNRDVDIERTGMIGSIQTIGKDMWAKVTELFSKRNDMDSTSIMDGANIVYPEVFKSSDYDKSYSISMKFYTPYGDAFSQFENVYLPLFSLLAMALPKQGTKNFFGDAYSGSVNAYSSPFILRADAPGNFSSDTCIISNLSFKREGGWTAHNQPIGIDVTLSLKDIYPMMIMSNTVEELNKNGTMLNYIANLAGIPIIEADKIAFGFKNKLDLWIDRAKIFAPSNIADNAKAEGLGLIENGLNKLLEMIS